MVTTETLIEQAIERSVATREAIRWAVEQERQQCAQACEQMLVKHAFNGSERAYNEALQAAAASIRSRA